MTAKFPDGFTLIFGESVTILSPITVTTGDVKWRGLGVKSENGNATVIKKGAGFVGSAGVIIGEGVDTVTRNQMNRLCGPRHKLKETSV